MRLNFAVLLPACGKSGDSGGGLECFQGKKQWDGIVLLAETPPTF